MAKFQMLGPVFAIIRRSNVQYPHCPVSTRRVRPYLQRPDSTGEYQTAPSISHLPPFMSHLSLGHGPNPKVLRQPWGGCNGQIGRHSVGIDQTLIMTS